MEFKDLLGRNFVVKQAEAGAKHSPKDIVTFEGSEKEVIMKCIRYPDGVYENDKISGGTQEEGTAYAVTITRLSDRIRINFDPISQEGSGGSGGSWTAEDMPTEPGNG